MRKPPRSKSDAWNFKGTGCLQKILLICRKVVIGVVNVTAKEKCHTGAVTNRIYRFEMLEFLAATLNSASLYDSQALIPLMTSEHAITCMIWQILFMEQRKL